MRSSDYDAVIVGSGPNGLAAAITLARAGWSVLVLEANATIGGSVRSAGLTLPGFVHDVCSAIYPLAVSSPFFRSLPLERFGNNPKRPFVLVAQQTVFDQTRAPEGNQTLWAYCHVPLSSIFDMAGRIEQQIERFAPGFRARILARHVMGPSDLEKSNANLVGGDVNGGAPNLRQLVARPVLSSVPYRTPLRGVYLCSSSTPPGGGVHGMCGYHAASVALRDLTWSF